MPRKKGATHVIFRSPERGIKDVKECPWSKKKIILSKDKEMKAIRKLKAHIAFVKRKVTLRVQQHEATLSKLERSYLYMEQLLQQLICLIEENREVIQEEREENLHLLELFENNLFSCGTNLKTQTVSPMVCGFPIKRASVNLKRVNNLCEGQGVNNSTVTVTHLQNILRDRTNMERRSSMRREKRVRKLKVPPRRNDVRPSNFSLHLNNADHDIYRSLSQGVSLKRASIHLKRLDPRMVSSEFSRRVTIQPAVREVHDASSQVESSSLGTPDLTTPKSAKSDNLSLSKEETDKKNMNISFPGLNFSQDSDVQNCSGDIVYPLSHQRPMVVLQRLERYEYFGGVTNSESTASRVNSSCSSNTSDFSSYIVPNETRRSVNISDMTTDIAERGNKSVVNEQLSRRNSDEKTYLMKKPLVTLVDIQDVNGKHYLRLPNKHVAKTDGIVKRSQSCQRKRNINALKGSSETGDKLDESYSISNTNEKEKKRKKGNKSGSICEEDPLEGPSWLYNSGLPEAVVTQFNKRRQMTLSLPIVDESSDESVSDESQIRRRKTLRERERFFSRIHAF